MEKISKTKEMPMLNKKFLEISNQLTECMLEIEKSSTL